MMSEPLPSGWHSAPSEARRWIRALLLVHLLSPRGSSCFSCYCPSLSFRLFHHHRHLLLRLFHFILFRSPPHSFSYRAAASPVLRTATRANIHHGVVTGPRSHGGWILGAVSRSPGIITGPPWGFNRPEVRHQRCTCSPLTILAQPALLCSYGFLRRALCHSLSAALIIVNADDWKNRKNQGSMDGGARLVVIDSPRRNIPGSLR